MLARSQTRRWNVWERDYDAVEFSTEEIERAMDYAMKMAGLKEVKKERSHLPRPFLPRFFLGGGGGGGLGTRLVYYQTRAI